MLGGGFREDFAWRKEIDGNFEFILAASHTLATDILYTFVCLVSAVANWDPSP
jgi:hypothetical protein